MDLASAKVIGAGLAAIGVGAAAIGVGNVFGSFLESAIRNPAAADGQQGRLFIGFAAAELLGLIAFAVAMIILYARLRRRRGRSRRPPRSEDANASAQSARADVAYSQFFWLLLVLGLIYFGIGKAMLPKIQSTVDARDKRIADDLAAAQAARAGGRRDRGGLSRPDRREPRRGAEGRRRGQGVERQGDRGADARRPMPRSARRSRRPRRGSARRPTPRSPTSRASRPRRRSDMVAAARRRLGQRGRGGQGREGGDGPWLSIQPADAPPRTEAHGAPEHHAEPTAFGPRRAGLDRAGDGRGVRAS